MLEGLLFVNYSRGLYKVTCSKAWLPCVGPGLPSFQALLHLPPFFLATQLHMDFERYNHDHRLTLSKCAYSYILALCCEDWSIHPYVNNTLPTRMPKMLNQNQSQITTTSMHDLTWLSAMGNQIARQSVKDHSLPNAEIGVDVGAGAGAGVDAESDQARKFAFEHKDTPQESQIAQSYKPTVLEHLLAMPLAWKMQWAGLLFLTMTTTTVYQYQVFRSVGTKYLYRLACTALVVGSSSKIPPWSHRFWLSMHRLYPPTRRCRWIADSLVYTRHTRGTTAFHPTSQSPNCHSLTERLNQGTPWAYSVPATNPPKQGSHSYYPLSMIRQSLDSSRKLNSDISWNRLDLREQAAGLRRLFRRVWWGLDGLGLRECLDIPESILGEVSLGILRGARSVCISLAALGDGLLAGRWAFPRICYCQLHW